MFFYVLFLLTGENAFYPRQCLEKTKLQLCILFVFLGVDCRSLRDVQVLMGVCVRVFELLLLWF